MKWIYRILFLLVISADAQQDSSLFYPNSPTISLKWLFDNSSIVLSGEVISMGSNSALLSNLEMYKGESILDDSFPITWTEGYTGNFAVNNTILVFADSLGNIDPRFGVHYPGLYLMDVIFIEDPVGGWPSRISRAVTYFIPEEKLNQVFEGKLTENEFIPINATLNFPLSGESLEFSIVQSGDSVCTVSNYSVLDSCQVTNCFDPPNGRVSFYAKVKKNRNFVRNGVAFWGGYDIAYVSDGLNVSFDSQHARTLEEFLDYAATGHKQEYNISINTDYDFSDLELNRTLVLHKSFYGYLGLWTSDSASMNLCHNPPEIMDYSHGYLCYELPFADSLADENLLCFRYADSLETSNFDIRSFWNFISQDDHLGEIFFFSSEDSIPRYLDSFSCYVEPYDDNLSNKDSLALFKDSIYRQMYSSNKPKYFLTEIGQPVFLTINHSEEVLSDTAYTYAWLLTNSGEIIHPTEISEITEVSVENANYCYSKFTYQFTIPDSIRGKLLVDIRSMDLARNSMWWSYGRSYWGIIDVIDSTDCHCRKR